MYSYTLRVRKTQSLKMSHCACARQCLSQRATNRTNSQVKLPSIFGNRLRLRRKVAAQHGLEAETAQQGCPSVLQSCGKGMRLPAAAVC